jgi:MFS family permease
LTTLSAVVGRLLIGLIVDTCDRRAVACGNFLVQSAGTALLAANPSAPMLYLGCMLFGLGLGNLISLPGLIVQQEFPQQHFSRIVGLIVAANQFAFAFGPGLLGFLQQARGDYTSALEACFIAEATAAAIVIFPRVRHLVGRTRARKEL